MKFKSGTGWKASFDPAAGRYMAEYGGSGDYHIYEIDQKIFDALSDGMTEGDAASLIYKDGRHLYMDINDRCGPPYTVVFDDNYKTLCPWANVVSSGKVWSDELTDAAVEAFSSEEKNRMQRRKKRAGKK
ncbi:MAG: hypothetical protein II776_02130 [Clostridia bacterium]|nr:hypothetical protein [Clostridia bacterium]